MVLFDGPTTKRNTPNVKILSGKISMGSQQSESMFVWDNEVPLVETFVNDAFMVNAEPVSIEEYMEFVRDGGYDQKHLWEQEDYAHFKEKGFTWPATWSYLGGEFYIHGHATTKHWKEIASEPVFVSLAEAQAYCKWAGDFRVMKEEEYHRALVDGGKAVHALREGGWVFTSASIDMYLQSFVVASHLRTRHLHVLTAMVPTLITGLLYLDMSKAPSLHPGFYHSIRLFF
ncbi:hypothetical protein L7F22_012285 [Adiantum nelumboides]|nr:hypothetical protein [Adiantum nelumboides]